MLTPQFGFCHSCLCICCKTFIFCKFCANKLFLATLKAIDDKTWQKYSSECNVQRFVSQNILYAHWLQAARHKVQSITSPARVSVCEYQMCFLWKLVLWLNLCDTKYCRRSYLFRLISMLICHCHHFYVGVPPPNLSLLLNMLDTNVADEESCKNTGEQLAIVAKTVHKSVRWLCWKCFIKQINISAFFWRHKCDGATWRGEKYLTGTGIWF